MSAAPGRPLPLITQDNEFFWTSGADGKLRLQECKACESLIHPPAPVCRYCRSRDMGVRAVSGKATLAGFTVNQRFSLPGHAGALRDRAGRHRRRPPGPADHQHRGVRSRSARTRSAGGGRLRAGRGRLAAAVPPGRRTPSPLRCRPTRSRRSVSANTSGPMLTAEKFEDKVALTGIGMSPIGRRLMAPPLSLTVQACEAAIADAGLTFADIDGLSTYPGGEQSRRIRRGRGDRSRGRAGYSADMAQRRHRDVRPGRFGDRRDARGRRRAGPPRALLPDAVGSHLQRADEAGQDRPVDGPRCRAGRCHSAPPRPHTPWR